MYLLYAKASVANSFLYKLSTWFLHNILIHKHRNLVFHFFSTAELFWLFPKLRPHSSKYFSEHLHTISSKTTAFITRICSDVGHQSCFKYSYLNNLSADHSPLSFTSAWVLASAMTYIHMLALKYLRCFHITTRLPKLPLLPVFFLSSLIEVMSLLTPRQH